MQWALALVLLLALVAPGLMVLVGVGLLVLLPAYLLATSAVTIFLAPQQILAVATNGRVRRNHACEHATVHVLEERHGPLPHVGGVATRDGFYLWGAEGFYPEALFSAAQEGLARMKRGERELAVHRRCGTSLVAARLVFALVFLGILAYMGYFSLAGVLLALLAGWMLGPSLGVVVQQWLTTSADVERIWIDQLGWVDQPELGGPGALIVPRGAYYFQTSQS